MKASFAVKKTIARRKRDSLERNCSGHQTTHSEFENALGHASHSSANHLKSLGPSLVPSKVYRLHARSRQAEMSSNIKNL